MATFNPGSGNAEDVREERRKRVLLGDLPRDFLRVTPISAEQQLDLDAQAALALQQQLSGNLAPTPVTGRLTVTVVEAKLNKNYGLTRMDPYVRLRIGQTIYETHTDYNGAKNPKWNKDFNSFFFPNATSIYIEIFDECAFSLDEKIAWAHYVVPEKVLAGETLNEWVPLSGKLGDEKEGFVNLVLTYQPVPSGTLIYHQPLVAVVPYGTVVANQPTAYQQYPVQSSRPDVAITPTQTQPPMQQPVKISEEDFQQVKEVFPNLDETIVRSVMESNLGDKESTINALLAMGEGT